MGKAGGIPIHFLILEHKSFEKKAQGIGLKRKNQGVRERRSGIKVDW